MSKIGNTANFNTPPIPQKNDDYAGLSCSSFALDGIEVRIIAANTIADEKNKKIE